MRSGAEFGGDVGVLVDGFEGSGSSVVAVFANKRVDDFVFTEFSDAGCEDDEIRIVGEGHARAVYGLVADPSGMELLRVEIDDGFADWLFDDFEVDLEAEFGGAEEALDVVANVEAAYCEATGLVASHDGLYVNDGQVAEEVVGGVVEHGAHGIFSA